MRKEDKKGLSTVIATILIVLLVMVAVVIVWSVVKNMLKKGSEEISLGKFTINLEIISVNQNSTSTNIHVRRNPGEGEVNGLIFAIFDGENTHVREVRNISLKELEEKTFSVDYNGTIVRVSVYPLFLTDSGRSQIGDLGDNYYEGGGSGTGDDDGDGDGGGTCTPDCENKNCGDDGCEGSCGECELDKTCSNGVCCIPLVEYGFEGVCRPVCIPDCSGRLCGTSCGATCGIGDCSILGENFFCNDSYMCEECIPDCSGGKNCGDDGCGGSCGECISPEECNIITGICEMCTPDCGTRECGPEPNGCGYCGDYGGNCPGTELCISGYCELDLLNTGIVTSIWPTPIGRNFLTGSNLPDYDETGDSYNLSYASYIKITSTYSRCYTILKLDYPINEGQATVIQVSTGTTDIEENDYYELWRTLTGCES